MIHTVKPANFFNTEYFNSKKVDMPFWNENKTAIFLII